MNTMKQLYKDDPIFFGFAMSYGGFFAMMIIVVLWQIITTPG